MTMPIEPRRPSPRAAGDLTGEDWTEIYYALSHKLGSATCQGSDRRSRQWRGHLRRIMRTIGPDGRNMTRQVSE